MTIIKKYFFTYFELAAWITGLAWLAIIDPAADTHFSLCFFKWIGLTFCPGCGLGHAVSWLLHGNIQHSLQAHPLGFFALVVLLHRIFTLIKYNLNLPSLKQ